MAAKKDNKVIEIPVEQVKVEEVMEQEQPKVKVELTVGMLENGQLYFNAGGDTNLLTLQGLVSYAEKQLEIMWYRAMQKVDEAQEPKE